MEQNSNKIFSEALLQAAEEFCMAVENCMHIEFNDFVKKMTVVLPTLYINTSAIQPSDDEETVMSEVAYDYLDENSYENIRRQLAVLLGEHDTYLETFEQDMKYSDTPIAATISESLADIFQPIYNFLSAVRDADDDSLNEIASRLKETFVEYWSQTLCNVMRPLNSILYDIHS